MLVDPVERHKEGQEASPQVVVVATGERTRIFFNMTDLQHNTLSNNS